MSQLVDLDLEAVKSQLRAFEADLESAQQQFDSLKDYAQQSESEIAQPSDYANVQSLSRQKEFIHSLRQAMSTQDQVIEQKSVYIEKIRAQLLTLYQKKESYLVLARQQHELELARQGKKEDDFLDELASKPQDEGL